METLEGRHAPGDLFHVLNALPFALADGPLARPYDWAPPGDYATRGGASLDATVSGEAFGLFSDLDVLGLIRLDVPPTPLVTLPEEGGEEFDQVLDLNVADLLTVEALTVYTAGEITDEFAFAFSAAELLSVGVLDLITVEVAQAVSWSFSDGIVAFSSDEGSTLLGTFGGIKFDLTPEPNTEIELLGIRIVLNEQFAGGDGVCTSELTVNMVHIYGDGTLLEGELIIASAHSAVNFCE